MDGWIDGFKEALAEFAYLTGDHSLIIYINPLLFLFFGFLGRTEGCMRPTFLLELQSVKEECQAPG